MRIDPSPPPLPEALQEGAQDLAFARNLPFAQDLPFTRDLPFARDLPLALVVGVPGAPAVDGQGSADGTGRDCGRAWEGGASLAPGRAGEEVGGESDPDPLPPPDMRWIDDAYAATGGTPTDLSDPWDINRGLLEYTGWYEQALSYCQDNLDQQAEAKSAGIPWDGYKFTLAGRDIISNKLDKLYNDCWDDLYVSSKIDQLNHQSEDAQDYDLFAATPYYGISDASNSGMLATDNYALRYVSPASFDIAEKVNAQLQANGLQSSLFELVMALQDEATRAGDLGAPVDGVPPESGA